MMSLHLLLLIAFLGSTFALALPEEQAFKTARESCIVSEHVPPSQYEKFKALQFPDEPETRCYIKCFFEKMHFFNPASGFNSPELNAAIEYMTAQTTNATAAQVEDTKASLRACADNNEQKSDSCTWAYRGFKCFADKHLQLLRGVIKSP